MVTLVRPKSMFLKCLIVMARPATIAGKYNPLAPVQIRSSEQ